MQLITNSVVRHLSEVGMRPAMVRNFMSFAYLPCHDIGIFGNVLADQEKCGFYMMGGEQIEELRRQFCARAVIERHRDVRSVDVDPIETDPGLGRGCRLWLFAGLRRNRVSPNSDGSDRNNKRKKEKTKDEHEFLWLRQTLAVSSRARM